MKKLFKADPVNPGGLSSFRLYLMRFYCVLAFVLLGMDSWKVIFTHKEPWSALPAVAFSFWAAFSLLMLPGLFNPLKMIPLLMLQFVYKTIWLIIAALPLISAGQLKGSPAEEMTTVFITGIIIDIIVIPWPYAVKNYVLAIERKTRNEPDSASL